MNWSHFFTYDKDSGKVYWRRSGREAGSHRVDGYINITCKGHQVLAHRLAFFLMTGRWPYQVDHKRGKSNHWENLRETTPMQNGANRQLPNKNNTSGVLGISYHKPRGTWRARYIRNGKVIHVGTFRTCEAATEALQQHLNRSNGNE